MIVLGCWLTYYYVVVHDSNLSLKNELDSKATKIELNEKCNELNDKISKKADIELVNIQFDNIKAQLNKLDAQDARMDTKLDKIYDKLDYHSKSWKVSINDSLVKYRNTVNDDRILNENGEYSDSSKILLLTKVTDR